MRTPPLVQGPVWARTVEGTSMLFYHCFSNIHVSASSAVITTPVLQMGKLRPDSGSLLGADTVVF